jgi:KDO2-lipid IV(A) lauroyltransferase
MRSFLAHVLAGLVGDVLRVRRAHVEASLVSAGVPDASRVARRMYYDLARGLIELIEMALGRSAVLSRVSVAAPELDGLRRRGFVVATAHTANWDLVACAFAQRFPVIVVTKHFRVRWLDRLWQSARARRGVRLVSEGSVMRRALPALQQGAALAMLIDQAPERTRGVLRAAFLGRPASVDLSPALLAQRARVPLVVAFPERCGDALSLRVTSIHEPPARASRSWAVRTMLEATRELEDFVRERPEQWLWMHRRWK